MKTIVDKCLLAAPVIVVGKRTLEVVHSPARCDGITLALLCHANGESRNRIFRRKLVSSIAPGYACFVTRVFRAACLAALVLASPVAVADEPKKPEPIDPGGAPAADLHQTVKTKKSRAELSQFLVKAAQKAQKDRAWAKAIPLYGALAVARGAASPEQKQLATLW